MVIDYESTSVCVECEQKKARLFQFILNSRQAWNGPALSLARTRWREKQSTAHRVGYASTIRTWHD